MEDKDLQNMWKSQDQKLDNILTLNKALMRDMLNEKLRRNVTSLRLPKRLLLLIGIPYTILLCFITWVAYQAGGFFVMVGFGMISIIMIATIIGYCYQLYL
ncbi:MAG: hypothetical protein HKO66_09930, partial [Saprospiraceae bacterium]|nr:hypothetical protein [Bacteroidia bacterium]NNE14552.1 hypothetical protein [Saprospiraceae bacterium]NNL92539.1 hypothetical protein [Saprospiraceae bacterium]